MLREERKVPWTAERKLAGLGGSELSKNKARKAMLRLPHPLFHQKEYKRAWNEVVPFDAIGNSELSSTGPSSVHEARSGYSQTAFVLPGLLWRFRLVPTSDGLGQR